MKFKQWYDDLDVSRDDFLDDGIVLYDDLRNKASEDNATFRVESTGNGGVRIAPDDSDIPSLDLNLAERNDAIRFLDALYDGGIHGYASMRHNMSRNN